MVALSLSKLEKREPYPLLNRLRGGSHAQITPSLEMHDSVTSFSQSSNLGVRSRRAVKKKSHIGARLQWK
jgi:hypothetical protein